MDPSGLPIETSDALAMAGLDPVLWKNLMAREAYEAAPPVKAGHPRYFDRDDMVSLFVLDHFNRLGLGGGPGMAARVATAVRDQLRRCGPKVQSLWVVATSSGKLHRVVSEQPPADMIRHEIPIAQLRQRIEELAAKRFADRRR